MFCLYFLLATLSISWKSFCYMPTDQCCLNNFPSFFHGVSLFNREIISFCRLDLVNKLILSFIIPSYSLDPFHSLSIFGCSRCNSFEDASMLLEELRMFDNQVYGVAHGLLMGYRETVWAQAQSLFDEVRHMDTATASAFYNALTDMLWHFGQVCRAALSLRYVICFV